MFYQIDRCPDIAEIHKQLLRLYKANLVILDEVGFQPISRQEANLLFGLINRLYQQTSIILTSNHRFEE